MADAFDAIEKSLEEGGGPQLTARPGQKRDAFEILQGQLEQPYSAINALTGGYLRDLPVVGPSIESGAQRAAAGIRSYLQGTPSEDELKNVQAFAERATAANPDYAKVGGLLSNTVGVGPLYGTAAFGARTVPALGRLGENLAVRMGIGGASTGALGAADAYMRGESPTAGAALGVAAGTAAPAVGGVLRGLVSPFNPVSRTIAQEARQPAIDILQREGVRLPAGDITGSKALQSFEDQLRHYPFVGATADEAINRRNVDFATAALRRVDPNIPAETLPTTGVLDAQHRQFQTAYNTIAGRTTLDTNAQPFRTDVNAAMRTYVDQRVAPGSRDPNVLAWTQHLDRLPTISGDQYQRFRTQLRQLADSARKEGVDTPESTAFRSMRSALDAQFARNATPEDTAALRDLNRRYGNLRAIEDAMSTTTQQASQGFLAPARLAAEAEKRSAGYSRGIGPDITDLARSGAAILRPLPESGTGRQLIGASVLSGVGAAGGAALGLRSDEDRATTAGILGGTGAVTLPVAAFLLGRGALSPAGQRFLINQWLSTPRAVSLAAGPLQQLTLPGRSPTLGNLGE